MVMLSNRDSLIAQLKGVLPYADSWYKGLADKQLIAIHKSNLSKIVAEAIRRDEEEVRRRVGLEPKQPRFEQLHLF
jgi:hypothetical protein